MGDGDQSNSVNRWLVALLVMLVLAVPVLGALTPFFESEKAVYGLDPGPDVTTTKNYNITSAAPYDGAGTVNITTENNGKATFESQDNVEVQVDQLEGTFSNFSQFNVTGGELRIDPGDKAPANVTGDIDSLEFRDGTVDDDTVDFTYSTSGNPTVEVKTDGTDGTTYGAVDKDTDEALAVDEADSNGRVRFDNLDSGTHDILIEELGTLTVREERPEHPKVDTVTAQFKFFEDEQDDPVIVNKTTSNGEIALTDLPTDDPFVVTISAQGYHNRTALLPDLSQQKTVFLLNKSVSSVENRFQVDDRTGEFPASQTELIVQHGINRSLYDPDADGFSWTNIAGDDLGADSAFVVDLQEEERYRIVVQNEDGDRRILGAYTAETTGTIDLDIGQVVIDPEANDGPTTNISRTNTSSVFIKAEFNDSTDETDTVYIEIYERNNESNVLFANTTFNGPLGSVAVTESVKDQYNDSEWVAKITYERGGETHQRIEIVGPSGGIVFPGMANWLRALLSIGSMFLIAGLFSRVNGAVGGLVVASMGGLFWFVGFTPDALGVGVVILAFVTAGLLFVNETRDGGFG